MHRILIMLMFTAMQSVSVAQYIRQLNATEGKLTFTVTTVNNNSTYSPKNVFAVWIKDSGGNFVASCKVMANTRKVHLVKWNANSAGNTVSAITGATLSNHQTHTVTWDGKNASGVIVPDGTYHIWTEYTSTNSANNGNPGPSISFEFVKGSQSQHLIPANAQYFKDILIDWSPATTVGFEESPLQKLVLSVYPSLSSGKPYIRLNLLQSSDVIINVYNLSGKLLLTTGSKRLPAGEHDFPVEPGNKKLTSGIYIVEAIAGMRKETTKMFIQ